MARLLVLLLAILFVSTTLADDVAHSIEELPAGHSDHGDAFNEGPRQAAYIMAGMGSTRFASSAKNEQAQAFIDQGVAQLHGFWYFEAERSFRQSAMLEPELAIAYWGMAMANTNNSARAIGFIEEAEKHLKTATEREKSYINAYAKYLRRGKTIQDDTKLSDDEKKSRRRKREEDYVKDLERIVDKSAEDVDAQALIALQLWAASRNELPITSHYAVDGLLDRVFAARPDHPAHHFRIHLWDNRRPENALASAAACGPSLPGIAHMWHMPGHIYSRLHRYGDAVWQQEASARVDHAHMMRDHVLPDQIHNFAHNNEWLIRNLLFLGQTRAAIAQAENLISLPQHPKYNSLSKGGSYRYGRERLLDAYTQYELWDETIAACDSAMLVDSEDFNDSIRRKQWLVVALQLADSPKKDDNRQRAAKLLRELQLQKLDLHRELILRSGPEPENEKVADGESDEKPAALDATKQKEKITKLREAIALGAAAAAVRKKDGKLLEKQLASAGKVDATLTAIWMAQAGGDKASLEKALTAIRKTVKDSPGQVRPPAVLVDLLWRTADKKAATGEFTKLQTLAGTADLQMPVLQRLRPIATELNLAEDWRTPAAPASDLGPRPPLDSLGPKTWTPYPMPTWQVRTASGEAVDSTAIDGQPTILIFYLGFGCLHCVEQLSAFSPVVPSLEKKGIRVLGISTENVDELALGMKNFDKPISIVLHSDDSMNSFKSFRCFDDFEGKPLHGTFLIDAHGRVRWQDIGHEPFTDVDFLLKESERLLMLP